MAKDDIKAIRAMAEHMAERREKEQRDRDRKAIIAASVDRPANDKEPLVNPFAAQHGDYGPAKVVDLGNRLGGGRQKTYNVTKNRAVSLVDKWLEKGGPGFDEPQARAIDHCRALWASAGNCGRLVANYGGFDCGDGGGRERDGWSQTEALAQLAEYEREIPRIYWRVFEMMARDDFSAGEAGIMFAGNDAQRQAHAKSSVGFCASLIAQWRGY